jgi:hypothetical protein
MSAWKKLNQQDVTLTSYIAKKSWSIQGENLYNEGIHLVPWASGSSYHPDPTPTPTPTPLPTATNTPVPTATPNPTATPEPTKTSTPSPTSTPKPTAQPDATATPQPTATATPVPTDTPEPTATATPEPTATPVPTSTPAPTSTPSPTKAPSITNYRIRQCGTEYDYNASKSNVCIGGSLSPNTNTYSVGQYVQFKYALSNIDCTGGATYCGEIISVNYSSTAANTDAMITRMPAVTGCSDNLHCVQ